MLKYYVYAPLSQHFLPCLCFAHHVFRGHLLVSWLYLSVITMLELETGILRVERRDQQQGKVLRDWLNNQVLPTFAGRTLVIDTAVARRCAALHVPDPRSDRDALIAATALGD